jgi:altronate hydrolase
MWVRCWRWDWVAEYTGPEKIAKVARESGRPAERFFIQEAGGTSKSIARGKEILARLRKESPAVKRVPMSLADLTVGCECGGSDGTSGLAGNPVAGAFFDRLVDAGVRAVFEETVEMLGLRHILESRAAHEQARRELIAAYDKAMTYCKQVRQFSASPGNFAGGLTTIEEKSMGAFAKSGSRPIQGVIKVAEAPRGPGLWIMDSVPDAHFMQFGYTNPNDGELEALITRVAAGEPAKPERLGHREYFLMYKHQDTPTFHSGCRA